jgi:hypothetical protein
MSQGRKMNIGIEFIKDKGNTKHFNITYKGSKGELIVWEENMGINAMWEDFEDGLFDKLMAQTGDYLEWAFKFEKEFLVYFKK